MTKQEYMKKFSFFARWYLPAAEAEDVIIDYSEMLRDHPDSSSIDHELENPRQAAKLLMEKKSYRRWISAFVLMVFCLLIPTSQMLRGWFYRRPFRLMLLLLFIGAAAALLYFRPRDKALRSPLPKRLLPALIALTASAVISALLLAGLANGFWKVFGTVVGSHGVAVGRYGLYAGMILQAFAAFSLTASFYGLVKARTDNHRWRALYIMALTALIVCTLVYATLHHMNLSLASDAFLRDYLIGLNKDVIGLGVFGLVGLTATGVALC